MNNKSKLIQTCKMLLAIIILFGPQFYLLHLNANWQTKAIFLICSIVVCLLFFQDKIQSFTISNNSLKVDWLVKNINATVDDLKNVVEPLIIFNLETLSTSTTGLTAPNYKADINFFKSSIALKDRLELNSDELTKAIYKAKKSVCTSTLYSLRNSLKDNKQCIIDVDDIVHHGLLEKDIHDFGQFVYSIHDENKEQAIKIYNDLIAFLRETSDIDENYCKNNSRDR